METLKLEIHKIIDRRCGLCQFSIEDREAAVCHIDENRVSVAIPFSLTKYFRDHEGIVHTFSLNHEPGHPDARHCFHDECYRLKLLPITAEFFAATDYAFPPLTRLAPERFSHNQQMLAVKLKLGVLNQLPLEICRKIAGYLVRQYVVAKAQELVSGVRTPDSLVRLSHDVYAQHVIIEGISYVQSLSNTPPPQSRNKVRVFRAQEGRVVQRIYIRYDHIGIRGVSFFLPEGDSSLPLESDGVWWTELFCEGGIPEVTVQTDGFKARELLGPAGSAPKSRFGPKPLGYCPAPAPGWPTPRGTRKILALSGGRAPEFDETNGLRMSAVECNMPGIEGYGVALNLFSPAGLYAHHGGIDPRLRQKFDCISSEIGFHWLYMPVDQGEYLRELWALTDAGAIQALMLLTSSGRAVVFGSYIDSPEIEFRRVFATTNRPSRIYFTEWNDEGMNNEVQIDLLGVDVDTADTDTSEHRGEGDSSSRYPHSLIPVSSPCRLPHGSSSRADPCGYSTSRLENVTAVTPCVNRGTRDGSIRPIMGMMLHYENGSRSCLGQYRPDWTLDTLRIDPARKLGIRIKLSAVAPGCSYPYVAEICVQGPPTPDSSYWMEVPWHGRLEWWYWHTYSELFAVK